MKISRDRFCELSKSRDFQSFLLNLDKNLYKELINHLKLGEGCQSNKKKMIEIYENIKSNDKLNYLEQFLLSKYPHMIVVDSDESKQINQNIIQVKASNTDELYDKMNYHKVFKLYRPSVLAIPQRKIFIGTSKNDVLNSITKFIRSKLNTEYVILQGPELWHGYVEYFDVKYKDLINDFDINKRPVLLYKKMNGID